MITISIPTLNRQKFLKKAITSVLNQTYKDFELIIYDNDPSNNLNYKTVSQFDDKRLSYIKSDIQYFQILSMGLKQNKRKYVMIMHDDDTLEPGYIENQLRILEENNKISIIASSVNLIDKDDHNLNKVRPVLFKDKVFTKNKFIYNYLFKGDIIPFPTAIYRSNFITNNNLEFPTDVGPAADLYLFFKINLQDSLIYLTKSSLYNYRVHSNQESEKNRISLEFEIRPHIVKLINQYGLKSLSKKYYQASAGFILHLIIFRFIEKKIDLKNLIKYYRYIRNDGLSLNLYSLYWTLFVVLRVIKLKLRINI